MFHSTALQWKKRKLLNLTKSRDYKNYQTNFDGWKPNLKLKFVCCEQTQTKEIYVTSPVFKLFSNTELLNLFWNNKKRKSAIHACHLYCCSYLLLPFPLLSRHNLSKCVRIQFLPPFSPTILYSMFVLFMRTQCKSPWKLFVTEMADIAWFISMSMSLDTNTTKPNANIIQSIKINS